MVSSDPIDLERLSDALDRILRDRSDVVAVYAYGSRVSGRPRPLSDLDLAILLDDGADRSDPLLAERLSIDVAQVLGTRAEIDAHLTDHLPLPVLGRVLTEGRLLYDSNPPRRVAFETSTRSRYFDFLPLLERDARDGIRSGR